MQSFSVRSAFKLILNTNHYLILIKNSFQAVFDWLMLGLSGKSFTKSTVYSAESPLVVVPWYDKVILLICKVNAVTCRSPGLPSSKMLNVSDWSSPPSESNSSHASSTLPRLPSQMPSAEQGDRAHYLITPNKMISSITFSLGGKAAHVTLY